MNKIKSNLITYLLSPLIDSKSTRDLKKFAEDIMGLEDFKDDEIQLVKCKDCKILSNGLRLMDTIEETKRMTKAIIKSNSKSYGQYSPSENKMYILLDAAARKSGLRIIKFDITNHKFTTKSSEEKFKIACTNILATMYHEKRHSYQHSLKNNSFLSTMYSMEQACLSLSKEAQKYYISNHDNWFIEIDANKVGINEAFKYVEKTNDERIDKRLLAKAKKRNNVLNKLYDFDSVFSYFNNLLKNKKDYEKINNTFSDYSWFKVLYGNDNELKSIDDIINNPLIEELDPRLIKEVFTSRYLNNNTDYNEMSNDACEILLAIFNKRLEEANDMVNDESITSIKGALTKLKDNVEYYQECIDRLNIRLMNEVVDNYKR